MKRTMQLTLVMGALFAAVACSGSNDPATDGGDGDGDGDGDGSGTGGSTPTGDGDGDGDGDGTGGSTPAGDGDGDLPGDGDGDVGTLGDPPCELLTSAAGPIAKDGACTPEDPQLCYKTCGPMGVGWKSETCTAGTYAEGDCTFPPEADYSCFATPDTQHEMCPTTVETTPQAGQACDVPECNACNFNNQYLTSSAELKVGYCVCQAPNGSGERTWSCASGTAWPCPLGAGCTQ